MGKAKPKLPKWWISHGDDVKGPFTKAYIVKTWKAGDYDDTTLACLDGTEDWKPLTEWPQFSGKATPPPPSRTSPHVQADSSDTEQVVIDTHSSTESTGQSHTSSGSTDLPKIPVSGVYIVIAIVLAFFGLGQFKSCVPSGCQVKSERQQWWENLQERTDEWTP